MKAFSLIAFSLPLITLHAFASPAELEGRWALTDRVCTDGVQPNDAFQSGRDKVIFSFGSSGSVSITTEINGAKTSDHGSYRINDHIAEISWESGKSDKHVVVVGRESYAFVTANFGNAGSCPRGTGLVTFFQRNRN